MSDTVHPSQSDTGATDSKIVLFADMLGFAALTEANPIEVSLLTRHERPLSLGIEDILVSRQNPLTEAFWRFHHAVRSTVRLASMEHSLTAITFSDSVFVATDYLFQAADVAVSLVQFLMPQEVPVRIGIAGGSFAALRFRSDVSLDGGDHASQFLGTAVVRANAAEKCGIKGLRILLHPSVVPLLDNDCHNPTALPGSSSRKIATLECSTSEQSNPVGVSQEVDYWHLGVTAEARAWKGLQYMWDSAPSHEVEHYVATAQAIDRMLTMQGRGPIRKLRSRTLPRRVRS